jgi:2-polyprenyl-3-methyl-5-hydroxy-6-metoxy-1,4-benzoquinol methylase
MVVNPEIDQDRVFDLADHFNRFGHPMFPQQQKIYQHIANLIDNKSVLEAGCGNGLGSAILDRYAKELTATDKLKRNTDFASCLYPWINFDTWDLNQHTKYRAQVVVCIEAFEHVQNPTQAINHLLEAATETIWLATPNGTEKPQPPDNIYHVQEYTPHEMLNMLQGHQTLIRNWDTWDLEKPDTQTDPLVYQIIK